MTTAAATTDKTATPSVPPKLPGNARARAVSDTPSVPSPPRGEGQGEGAATQATAPAADAKAPAIDPAKLAELEEASVKLLGKVTWLLSLSPQHRYMFLADLEWRIRPAVALRQCRVFHQDGRAVAYVSWAFVNDEVAARLQLMPGRLAPNEWRCGSRLMLIDVVAPFGGAEQLVQAVIKQHGKGPVSQRTTKA